MYGIICIIHIYVPPPFLVANYFLALVGVSYIIRKVFERLHELVLPFSLMFVHFPGTNGAITLGGTLASLVGGLLVGLAHFLTNWLLLPPTNPSRPPQYTLVVWGAFGGLVGSIFDSLLGATLQYSGERFGRARVLFENRPALYFF